MRISRHQFYTIANRKVHEQKIKRTLPLISWYQISGPVTSSSARLYWKEKKKTFATIIHSRIGKRKREGGSEMANAAVAAPQPPPLHLYWYMLGSAAAPQEKNRTFATTWMHSVWYWSKLPSYYTPCKHLFFWNTSINILHMEKLCTWSS